MSQRSALTAAATATADAPEAPKKKGKKLLFVIIGVLVLAIAGAAGALFILKKNTAEDDHEEDAPVAHVKKVDPKHAPTFLPLENMVVNLADTGGNRYIQIGLTLQLQDAHTGDAVKAFMPSIRNAVLLILSQRTTDELLQVQGKEQLAADVIAEISRQLGFDGKRNNPIQAVLFSSFIVQ